MPKNIVVCCDGTGNEYGDENSNVVRLYEALDRRGAQSVAYYHPGVGTIGAENALTAFGKAWTKFRGLAFGYGLSENIADAYRFLMNAFEPGDRLFIFGFSRGAYTARALCGMLEMMGLLVPGNEGLIPYAIRLFKRKDSTFFAALRTRPNKFQIAAGFKKTFGRDCRPYFLGLWDTVSSVGWILDPIGLKPGTLPYTFELDEVTTIRHAVSIDERRAFFRTNLVHEVPGRDLRQVWFAGVHSDVGGSYPEAESGLSKISLRWMFDEARRAGLMLDEAMVDRILGGSRTRARPLATALEHNSLTPTWWAGEFWPKTTKYRVSPPDEEPPRFKRRPRLNLFRRRFIAEGSRIHQSVAVRMQQVPSYLPGNLPKAYVVENASPVDPYPVRLRPHDQATVVIFAKAKWNDTAIHLERGQTYRLEAKGRWHDASIATGAAGYPSPNIGFRLVEPLRRARRQNWFALIGALGQDERTAFLIGDRRDLTVPADGILQCFANDIPFLYGNNSGSLELTITRLT